MKSFKLTELKKIAKDNNRQISGNKSLLCDKLNDILPIKKCVTRASRSSSPQLRVKDVGFIRGAGRNPPGRTTRCTCESISRGQYALRLGHGRHDEASTRKVDQPCLEPSFFLTSWGELCQLSCFGRVKLAIDVQLP